MANIKGISYDPDFIAFIYGAESFKLEKQPMLGVRKYHVLSIVDGDQIVTKWWAGSSWVYEVIWLYVLSLHWPQRFYL